VLVSAAHDGVAFEMPHTGIGSRRQAVAR
jgi:hypothetical protein